MDMCQHKAVQHIEFTTSRSNAKVNYGLWVTVICQCRFIKSTVTNVPLAGGGGLIMEEALRVWVYMSYLCTFFSILL